MDKVVVVGNVRKEEGSNKTLKNRQSDTSLNHIIHSMVFILSSKNEWTEAEWSEEGSEAGEWGRFRVSEEIAHRKREREDEWWMDSIEWMMWFRVVPLCLFLSVLLLPSSLFLLTFPMTITSSIHTNTVGWQTSAVTLSPDPDYGWTPLSQNPSSKWQLGRKASHVLLLSLDPPFQ